MSPVRTAFTVLSVILLSACYNGDTDSFIQAFDAAELDIQSISLDDNNTAMETGQTLTYTVSATQNSGGTIDVSNRVSYSVADGDIASITSSGVLTGLAVGQTTVTVSFASFEDSVPIEVSNRPLESISIEFEADAFATGSAANEIPVCTSGYQLIARGDYGDLTGGGDDIRVITDLVNWNSDNTASANIDEDAQVTSFAVGTANITATRAFPATDPLVTSNTQEATSIDTINSDSIVVARENNAANTSMVVGDIRQYAAEATFSFGDMPTLDITEGATWSLFAADSTVLGDPNVAGAKGQVEALNAGDVELVVTCEAQTDRIDVNVIDEIEVTSIRIDDDDTGNDGEETERVEKNVGDSDFQLYAFAVRNNGTEVNITNDDDITWRVRSGDEDILSVDDDDDKGEVTINAEGVGQIEILFEGFEDDIVIDVEE